MADLLDKNFIGRHIDKDFINALPKNIDICGENGEYHTFCYDGKIFRFPVSYQLGSSLKKTFPVKLDDGTSKKFSYWYADLNG